MNALLDRGIEFEGVEREPERGKTRQHRRARRTRGKRQDVAPVAAQHHFGDGIDDEWQHHQPRDPQARRVPPGNRIQPPGEGGHDEHNRECPRVERVDHDGRDTKHQDAAHFDPPVWQRAIDQARDDGRHDQDLQGGEHRQSSIGPRCGSRLRASARKACAVGESGVSER